MKYSLPYGRKSLTLELDQERVLYQALPLQTGEIKSPETLIEHSLDEPIGSPPLEALVTPDMYIALLVDDLTRPTPKKLLVEAILERLHKAGVPDAHIRLFVALGTHRQLTEEEIEQTIGLQLAKRYRLGNFDYKDRSQFVSLGKTASGIPIEVYRELLKTDFRIAIGNIVPHIAAGWGGGAKMIQPGMCSEATTEMTHLIACIDQNVMEVCGNPENLCRREIEEITEKVGLHFIVNTVMDEHKRLLGVFSGHYVKAHRRGVELAKKVMCPPIPKQADIVIASANPADIDFWQGCKPYIFAQFGVRKGGVMIFALQAREGLCGNAFHHTQTLMKYGSMPFEEIRQAVKNGEVKDIVGINVPLFIARLAGRVRVILVSDGISVHEAASIGFEKASTIPEALKMAEETVGSDASIGLIPFAGETLVQLAYQSEHEQFSGNSPGAACSP